MPVGHLLAAGEVQADQGAETQEEGEVEHEKEILHGARPPPASLRVGGPEPLSASMCRPRRAPGGSTHSLPKHPPFLCHAGPLHRPGDGALSGCPAVTGMPALGRPGAVSRAWARRMSHTGQLPHSLLSEGSPATPQAPCRQCHSTGPGPWMLTGDLGHSTSNSDADRASSRTSRNTGAPLPHVLGECLRCPDPCHTRFLRTLPSARVHRLSRSKGAVTHGKAAGGPCPRGHIWAMFLWHHVKHKNNHSGKWTDFTIKSKTSIL